MKILTIDGIHLEVTVTGKTDATQSILFIHGMRQSSASFKYQLEDPTLFTQYKLISFDLRGHGLSDKPTEITTYSAEMQAADIKLVIDTCSPGVKPIVCAWSFGATLLCDYIKQYGCSGLSGIIWASPFTRSGCLSHPGSKEIDYKIFTDAASQDTVIKRSAIERFVDLLTEHPMTYDFRESCIQINLATSDMAVWGMYRGDSDSTAVLATLTSLPHLLIYGNDPFIGESDILEDAACLKQVTVLKMPEVGHSPFIENPRVFNAYLSNFTRSLSPAHSLPLSALFYSQMQEAAPLSGYSLDGSK